MFAHLKGAFFVPAIVLALYLGFSLQDIAHSQPSKSGLSETPGSAISSQTLSATTAKDLLELNETFRSSYSKAKSRILTDIGPVVMLVQDRMILVQGKQRKEALLLPDTFTVLKTIDHLPLATFLQLQDGTDSPMLKETSQVLERLKALAFKINDELAGCGLEAEEIKRQRSIIRRSVSFIDMVLAGGRVSAEELQRFAGQMSPVSMSNVDDAVGMQLARMNMVMMAWKKEMSAENWNQLQVVIAGSHMARSDNVAFQYFAQLFNEKREGLRIIYMEDADTEERALDLLATHILDRRIAIAYFKDPWRMHRDLLGDGARDFLRQHPPGR